LDQWKSAAYATAKLFLCEAEESANASSSLNHVVAGLCFILENSEVSPPSPTRQLQRSQVPQRTKANKQAIESLAPRVKALSASLCAPVSEGDDKEGMRRKELER